MRTVDLAHETCGEGPTVLMLMGIGAPRVLWPEALLRQIADAGFRVVWCDNRDSGDSPRSAAPAPSPLASILRSLVGLPVAAPYTLSDMAADCVALLDRLGAKRAHVVGASMGGMIAQTLAVEHPGRVASLTSIMSSTGSRRAGLPGLGALRAVTTKEPIHSLDDQRARLRRLTTILGSGRFEPDPARLERVAEATWRQATPPEALARQLAAILAMGRRTPSLRTIRAPTLILHGAQDPLFPPRFAREQARAIPGAELAFIDGMGHDLPTPLLHEIGGRILDHLHAVEAKRR